MKFIFKISLFIILSAFLFSISSSIPSAEEKKGKEMLINGSSTVKPVVTVAARIYGKRNGLKIKVEEGGSSLGIKSIGEGTVDIGMTSRYLKPEEKKKYPMIVQHVIGFDGIAIIVNAKNPVASITKDQLQKIYTGKITNWKELGGPDLPILLISKEEGRSTLDLFLEYTDMSVKTSGEKIFYKMKKDEEFSSTPAVIIGANSGAIMKVSEDPKAIGYVSIGAAERAEGKTGMIKRLQLDGIPATRENVRNKTYPILRPLIIMTNGNPSGHIKGLVDYILSKDGQNIVKNIDYIPLE